LLGIWLQPGGHIKKNDSSLLNVALREAIEETGLKSIQPISSDIFDLDIHQIPKNILFPKHKHFDIRFLLFSSHFSIEKLSF